MFDELPTLDLDAPAFYEQQTDDTRNVEVTLHDDRTHRRLAECRSFLDYRNTPNAARQLDRLPSPGESIHSIMRANFDAFEFVPAILHLAQPAKCLELNIATLGFNERNAAALIDLLDIGAIKQASFIGSHFWKSHEGPVYDDLHAALTQRGHRCLAMRCHAKLLLFEFDDGQAYTMEMSANLRSCRNLEQFVLTNDPNLLRFHRGWMNDVLTEAEL